MRLVIATSLAMMITGGALAQTAPAPRPMKLFAASGEIPKLIERAKAERKGEAPLVSVPILSLAPYNANLEYRPGNGPPAVHFKDAEMFYVLEGSATMITGGQLANPEPINADNQRGTAITGGETRSISKGDFIIVPENTPHQIMPTGGAPVVLMSVHMPRPTQWP